MVILRIAIGLLLCISGARFLALGWVEDHYVAPLLHFSYYGFDWLPMVSAELIYAIHGLMILAALCVMLGFYYRLSIVVLFLTFTYTELIDMVYYLNHYYFVSIVLFMLIFAPAHRYFSLDAWRNPNLIAAHIPRFWILSFQLMLAIVYIYAGLAKINYAWLIEALPLKIWLPAADATPIIGPLFAWKPMPYIFSWVGMLYDCTIVFWLLWSRSRPFAYALVIVFHLLTGILFQIGVFPLVMIAATLIFFSESWHLRSLDLLRRIFPFLSGNEVSTHNRFKPVGGKMLIAAGLFFAFQLLFPWRYVLYPGNVFWTEEGYRFSWRVMLMEKAGTATFYVKDGRTGREGVVVNGEFLNSHQEKQMAMQPDLILQFAHFLADHYEAEGVNEPSVRAEVYVTLNARPSQLLIDPSRDLSQIEDSWKPKDWILPAP